MSNNQIKEYDVVMCIKCEEWFLENVTLITSTRSCTSNPFKKVHWCSKCGSNMLIKNQEYRHEREKWGIQTDILSEYSKQQDIIENYWIHELITPYYHPTLAY